MTSQVGMTALISLSTGVGGYWLKYYLDKKQNATSANAKFKRKLYQGFVENMIRFYSPTQPLDAASVEKRTKEFRRNTEDFHKRFALDASPSVIRAVKNLQQFHRRANEKGEQVNGRRGTIKVAKVFKKMRRDMGNTNWGIGYSASVMFGPVLMNTYEQEIHPLWWSIKRVIYIKVGPVRWLRSTYIKLKAAFYAWSARLESKPPERKVKK
jgi:hypothetical protein